MTGAVGSENRADAAQKIAFAVVDALDDHGAVQVQQRTVDRHGGFESLQELGLEARPGFGVDRAGGFGEGPRAAGLARSRGLPRCR